MVPIEEMLKEMTEGLYLAIRKWSDVSAFFRKHLFLEPKQKAEILNEKQNRQFFFSDADFSLTHDFNIFLFQSEVTHVPLPAHCNSGKSD